MKRVLGSIFAFLIIASSIFAPVLALAQDGGSYNFSEQSGLDKTGAAAGYDIGASAPTLEGYVSKIITVIISVLGVIFLALIIYAGITWMTAQGNEEKVRKAKELLTESIIGLIIVLAAYAISYFVLQLVLTTKS
ncbi:MAG: hypothetical protein Q8Q67_00905 [bacterium]|nr:hypothetical protein [bacterium]